MLPAAIGGSEASREGWTYESMQLRHREEWNPKIQAREYRIHRL